MFTNKNGSFSSYLCTLLEKTLNDGETVCLIGIINFDNELFVL